MRKVFHYFVNFFQCSMCLSCMCNRPVLCMYMCSTIAPVIMWVREGKGENILWLKLFAKNNSEVHKDSRCDAHEDYELVLVLSKCKQQHILALTHYQCSYQGSRLTLIESTSVCRRKKWTVFQFQNTYALKSHKKLIESKKVFKFL